jgi:hypothetical protein
MSSSSSWITFWTVVGVAAMVLHRLAFFVWRAYQGRA